MSKAAATQKPKRPRRPVYFRVERLVRIETGEEVGALVPLTKWDARAMRDRKYSTGSELRAELKKRRNVKFHRLAHAIGALAVEQLPDFHNLSAHDAIKRLQRECGACCEEMQMDLGPVVGTVAVKVPRSIAFDEMDESEFQQLVGSIYRHLAAKYWPDMDEEAVEELVLMYESNGQ